MLRGFISAVILIISIVVIELVVSGNLELQHASIETFLKGSLYIPLQFLLLHYLMMLRIKLITILTNWKKQDAVK
jgi:hypothetical protein